MRPMALTAGDRLGPYEITDTIGSGGVGDVYRARDTRLGVLVYNLRHGTTTKLTQAGSHFSACCVGPIPARARSCSCSSGSTN